MSLTMQRTMYVVMILVGIYGMFRQGAVFMREKFEEWAKDFVKARDSNDRYTSPYTQAAWDGWQAAFASGAATRWPIQPEGIGLILTEALNIPEIATKIAKTIQSGNY